MNGLLGAVVRMPRLRRAAGHTSPAETQRVRSALCPHAPGVPAALQVKHIVLKAAFLNCGQNCAGGERFFVHDKVYDKFLDMVGWKGSRVGAPLPYSRHRTLLLELPPCLLLSKQIPHFVAPLNLTRI